MLGIVKGAWGKWTHCTRSGASDQRNAGGLGVFHVVMKRIRVIALETYRSALESVKFKAYNSTDRYNQYITMFGRFHKYRNETIPL